MSDALTFGLFFMNMEMCSYPEAAARIALLAEAASSRGGGTWARAATS